MQSQAWSYRTPLLESWFLAWEQQRKGSNIWLYQKPPKYEKSFSPTSMRPQKWVPLTGHGKQAGLRSQRVELITCDITSSKRILHCHACSAVCNVASVRCAVGACAVVSAPLQKCAHATAARYGVTWKYFWEGCTSKDACVR